jgi:hypothetical protein
MDTIASNIPLNLDNLKLVTTTQVDLSYFNSIVGYLFKDPSVYANITSDVQFINQIGSQLFNYFSNQDPAAQKVWYIALASGCNQTIVDANNLIKQIPSDNPKGLDLAVVLNILITDCQSIQKIIPLSL